MVHTEFPRPPKLIPIHADSLLVELCGEPTDALLLHPPSTTC